jgi:hypothetical protein
VSIDPGLIGETAVLIIAEIEHPDEDDEPTTSVHWKCSSPRATVPIGMTQLAIGGLTEGERVDDE